MSSTQFTDDNSFLERFRSRSFWKRVALLFALPAVLLLVLFLVLWNVFFHYVPPGHMLIVISKGGELLPEGEVLAEPGQKGIQKQVRGEGWHFVWPILHTTERKPNIVIKPGQVGIVTAKGGKVPPGGSELADNDDERGIRRLVLLPGSYRFNPYGYSVETVDMVRIQPGFIGVKRRLLGKDGKGPFAQGPEQKGILRDEILQPGIYPVNTREYEVIPCEVGVYQTSYLYDRDPKQSTALTFQARDGNTISLDCTIEWEIKPEYWPTWLTRFRDRHAIEQRVVKLHAEQLAQVAGNHYGAQDFLDGRGRLDFQKDFEKKLAAACLYGSAEVKGAVNELGFVNNVVVKNAFIRNIIIPDTFLEQKRKERVVVETRLTNQELTITAQTKADVAEAKRTIDLKVAEVQADTSRMVALVERDTENVRVLTEAELEQIKAEYGTKTAELEAQRTKELGEAEAEAKKVKETATASIYKMKLDLFKNDGEAYLRYTMAQQLNPNLRLRLFHSGPGTLWTNMGNKEMNFMLPLPTAEK